MGFYADKTVWVSKNLGDVLVKDLVLTINLDSNWHRRLVSLFGELIAVRAMSPEQLHDIKPSELTMLRAVVCQGPLLYLQDGLMELHASWRFRHAAILHLGSLENDRERVLADALGIRATYSEKEFDAQLQSFVADIQRRTMNQAALARLEGTLAQQLGELQVVAARKTIESMVVLSSYYRRWLVYVAAACEKLNDFAQAEACYAEVHKHFPFMFQAKIGLANAMVRRQNFAPAFQLYSETEKQCSDLIGMLLLMDHAGERHALASPFSALAKLSERLFGEQFAMAYYQGYAEAMLRTQGVASSKDDFLNSLEQVGTGPILRIKNSTTSNVSAPALALREKADDIPGFDMLAEESSPTTRAASMQIQPVPLQVETVLRTLKAQNVDYSQQKLPNKFSVFSPDRILVYHPDPNDGEMLRTLLSDQPNRAQVCSDERQLVPLLRAQPFELVVGWHETGRSNMAVIIEDILAARDLDYISTIVLCPGDKSIQDFNAVASTLLFEHVARVDRTRRGMDACMQHAALVRNKGDTNRNLLDQLRQRIKAMTMRGQSLTDGDIDACLAGADMSLRNAYWLKAEKANALIQLQKFEDAARMTKVLVREYPDLIDAWILNAWACVKAERQYRAGKDLFDFLSHRPSISVEKCLQVGRILYACKDISGLHRFLQFWKAHHKVASDHRYHYLMAHYSRQVGDKLAYIDYLLRAAHEAPLIWEYQRALATFLEGESMHAQAQTVWLYARNLWRSEELVCDLGLVRSYVATKQVAKAAELLNELRQKYPQHSEVMALQSQLPRRAS